MELHLPGWFAVCDYMIADMMIIRARSGQLPPLEDTMFDKRSPPPIRSSAVRHRCMCDQVYKINHKMFELFVAITNMLAFLAQQKLPHMCRKSWRILQNKIVSFRTEDVDEYKTRCNLCEPDQFQQT